MISHPTSKVLTILNRKSCKNTTSKPLLNPTAHFEILFLLEITIFSKLSIYTAFHIPYSCSNTCIDETALCGDIYCRTWTSIVFRCWIHVCWGVTDHRIQINSVLKSLLRNSHIYKRKIWQAVEIYKYSNNLIPYTKNIPFPNNLILTTTLH